MALLAAGEGRYTPGMDPSNRTTAIRLNRLAYGISRQWVLLFSLLWGFYVGLPFLAPVLMANGLVPLGRVIYTIYSFLCHQLPERSYFLFGPAIMVPLEKLQAAGLNTDNPFLLRQFLGSPELGWKVAWSDRMVAMFTSMLVFAWMWWLLRAIGQKPRIGKWLFLALLLPLALDGTTHLISDLGGLHQGFRDSNAWLAALTQNTFPPTFYAGDAWGSFNASLRLLSGILFGLGIVWFGFPYLDEYFIDLAERIKYKFTRVNLAI